MREIGVLVLIFVPLDVMLEWNQKVVFRYPAWLHGMLNWLTPEKFWVFFFIVVAVAMLYWGIKWETAATVELEAEEGDHHNADRPFPV